ncbi:MAG: hypothetical protein RR585_06780 [Coprobacillus sp.]
MIEYRDIYIAKFIREDTDENSNPIKVYDTPIPLCCTINSLNGSYDIAVYGDKMTRMCKTILDYEEWINNIKEKDVVYLYGVTPENEVVNGCDANYEVDAVLPQNKKILVYFKRIV